ncbi:Hint domain-containing protein [Thioclava sp. GXIMD4215]|uniref:Hint domain-containing protein n=1 Tax=Thioclava sp. GXIMD4215 TaxID=3131928 RepID=UPI0032558C3D
MADTSSWGWYSSSTWPGYSAASQDNLNASGNGRSVDPAGYTEITLHDTNNDGIIWDYDTDDVHSPDPAEYISGPSLNLYPQEIALYTNSTMVVNGVTYSGLEIEVTLFTDGTWGARLMDSSIPAGVHYSNVQSITLGTWDGVEYDGVTIAHVDAPFVCFAQDTRIMTVDGPRPVQNLTPRDRLITPHGPPARILWIGCREVAALGRAAPIRFAKGILGNTRALLVSAHHRVLVSHPALEDLTGYRQGLAAARHLVGLRSGIQPVAYPRLRYWHILTEHHQVIMAEGAWAETLYPGTEAWAMLGPACQKLIRQSLPQLSRLPADYGPLAYPALSGRICRKLGPALLPHNQSRGLEKGVA